MSSPRINKPAGVRNEAQRPARQTAADRFLEQAMRFRGQPYLWGGGHGGTFDKPGPVDCSGLVTQAARLAGVNLDGTAEVQQDRGRPVGMNDLRPGDLVFKGNPAHHVGIYIGNGLVLHAPHTGDVVRITSVNNFDNARRVFDEAGQPVQGAAIDQGEPAAAGGGDSARVGGGSQASGIGMGSYNDPGEGYWTKKLREDREAAANLPAAGSHSGLRNVNSHDVGNFGNLLARLETQGLSREVLEQLSQQYGVPLELILAVIQQESGGNANARSPVGAQGLMQLMPDTARGLGVQNPFDPRQNVEGGVKYLAQMLQQFDGDVQLALAGYNAGPGNVQRYGGVPPFAETQSYVRNITGMLGNA